MKAFVLLFFISLNAWSMDRLQLVFEESQFSQGALVRAQLLVPLESVNVPVQKLKGENFAETIFFHQISPLIRKEGESSYNSEVVVIFTKVPAGNSIIGKIGNVEVQLEWNEVTVSPVESSGQMQWADFTAPDFLVRSWGWIFWGLLTILIIASGVWGWKKYSFKKKEKERLRKLVQEIRSCQNYDEIVNFWKKKRSYLKDFPHLESAIPAFESILFKYSFKPSQSETEKSEVVKAYKKLMEESEGGFRGI